MFEIKSTVMEKVFLRDSLDASLFWLSIMTDTATVEISIRMTSETEIPKAILVLRLIFIDSFSRLIRVLKQDLLNLAVHALTSAIIGP